MNDLITGFVSDAYNWYRKRKADQVHVEAYWYDEVWEAIQDVDYSDVVWYVMTPVNYDYFRNYLGVEMSEFRLDKVMSRRVKELDERYDLGLHIHFWWMKSMPTDMKRKMFSNSLYWLEDMGIEVKEFVPGWWNYDEDLEQLCGEFDLKLVKKGFAVHDYEFLEV